MKNSKKIILAVYLSITLVLSSFFILALNIPQLTSLTGPRYPYQQNFILPEFIISEHSVVEAVGIIWRNGAKETLKPSAILSGLILFVLWLFVYRRSKFIHGNFNLLGFIVIFFPVYFLYSLTLLGRSPFGWFLSLVFCIFGLPVLNLLSRYIFEFSISLKSAYVAGILLTALTTFLSFYISLSIYGFGPGFNF